MNPPIDPAILNEALDKLKPPSRAAGPIRNAQMAAMGDLVIAFPGGRGTADMVRQADARGLPVYRREQPEPIDRPGN